MRKVGLLLAGISALALAACGTGGIPPTTLGDYAAKAGAAVTKAEERYATVAVVVDRVAPHLPERQADRLRMLQSMVEAALVAARTATTVAGQLAAVKEAEAATAELDAATPAPG